MFRKTSSVLFRKQSRVLVLYTGGTIGMTKNADGVYSPEKGSLLEMVRAMPPLHDKDYAAKHLQGGEKELYVLPPVAGCERRVVYECVEYEPLLDSSDMSYDDWIRIASDIYQAYDSYDGFVVLHGTDTLAYTASALSFMLEGLGKPVVVTGAQIPVCEVRSDGRENLVGALVVAASFDIPEVSVYFNNKLMRGNRVSKLDNSALDAFTSPNMRPLAEMEIQIKVDRDAVFRSGGAERLSLHTRLDRRLSVLRIFPSMGIHAVRGCLEAVDGVVLQTYGAGNVPSQRLDILEALREAVERGVFVLNCSQCVRGKVDRAYACGKLLSDIGVISGADMTPECALTKLAYVLGRADWDRDAKRQALESSLRGELTSALRPSETLQDLELVPRLARFLQLSTSEEMGTLRDALYPPLICTAANQGDVELLRKLKESGANLSSVDYDGRSGLHVAASAGHLGAVAFLLHHGVSVHQRDRWNETPLLSALRNKHPEVVGLLRHAGSGLGLSRLELGAELCLLAAKGDVAALADWKAAGADLSAPDYAGRTPLHVAKAQGQGRAQAFLTGLKSPHAPLKDRNDNALNILIK